VRFPPQWHIEVQQQDVRLRFEHALHDLCCIVSMANDPEIRLDLKQTSQSIGESWMVDGYDNADGGGLHNFASLVGQKTQLTIYGTLVPV
jgi:hypothetical protein